MRALAIALLLAACSGSADAPRPIAPSSTDERQGTEDVEQYTDDDSDGIPNDHDGCPLAHESGTGLDRDGCPDSVDAGVAPIP